MSAQPVVMSSKVQPCVFRPVPATVCDVTIGATRADLAAESYRPMRLTAR